MAKAENIDQYLAHHSKWNDELKSLRDLLLS